ncbi:MAG: hypothetical protein IPJ65_00495 [Archangiaceae bacterium]|nr:hypothetical protein [Archangiaceae bacterium]
MTEQDSAYYLAWEILQKHRPWKEIFLGPYRVEKNAADTVVVSVDPQGLGYFRSSAWLKRYAGNEPNGVKLSTAYRIFNNTIGPKLVPSTNTPGRRHQLDRPPVAGCRQLPLRQPLRSTSPPACWASASAPATMTFSPPDRTKVTLLGGRHGERRPRAGHRAGQSEAFRFPHLPPGLQLPLGAQREPLRRRRRSSAA